MYVDRRLVKRSEGEAKRMGVGGHKGRKQPQKKDEMNTKKPRKQKQKGPRLKKDDIYVS
jgi:hypothetical protein